MKRLYPIAFILVCPFLFSYCGSTPFCSGGTKNKGDIIGVFQITECFNPKSGMQNRFVVRSADDLDTAGCHLSQDPVDFQQFSILGNPVSGGCKLRIISREVRIDHEAKTCTYTTTFKDCGFCKSLIVNFNTVLVPAVPKDYEVIFKVIEK